jgi:Xaa-Pro aminopeptidase
MSEYEIDAQLAFETERRGAQAIVNLIATDERIFKFRHPLPTAKKLDRYAMLVLCGRRDGLVCSITRLIRFGKLPDSLRVKAQAVAQIDATFILGTRPGRALGEIFGSAQAAYASTGFADEWQYHHQGGPAGYEAREVIATPEMTQPSSPGRSTRGTRRLPAPSPRTRSWSARAATKCSRPSRAGRRGRSRSTGRASRARRS